jgi:hypothetical protein
MIKVIKSAHRTQSRDLLPDPGEASLFLATVAQCDLLFYFLFCRFANCFCCFFFNFCKLMGAGEEQHCWAQSALVLSELAESCDVWVPSEIGKTKGDFPMLMLTHPTLH